MSKESDRLYYIKNREKILKMANEYRKKNIDIIREKNRLYRLKNKTRIAEYKKKNRDRINKSRVRWIAINKDRAKFYRRNYIEQDWYVKKVSFKGIDVPKELIDIKRINIKIRRILKSIQQKGEKMVKRNMNVIS